MRIVVVGAGIVGVATARQLAIDRPDAEITVVDKEPMVAGHQTGHNSGVIHAGIYYPPGSLKAELCRRGSGLLKEFCADKGIPYQNIGKLVVALDADEADRLDEVKRRALANGVDDVRMIGASEITDIEPYVQGVRALYSPSTAIVDFVAVTQAIADDLVARGGAVRTSTPVTGFRQEEHGVVVLTGSGEIVADEVVICGGLQSARLAVLTGDDPEPAIIPFRGEYYRIAQEHAHLVKGLVYPVPDPRYPFLGIHLTRRIDGTVDIGPNAVLALALEGYQRTDVSASDLAAVLRTPAFRKLAKTHWRTGAKEMVGSVSKRYFLAQARKYLPALALSDLEPAPAGVRAQAIKNDGQLVDDFWITRRPRMTLVRNAPSPAATSSLAIAEHITRQVLEGVPS
ncbi:L-2-hydroxyglutarate oxidase [Nakamurella sp. GG22]